jgi:hypothetical protein
MKLDQMIARKQAVHGHDLVEEFIQKGAYKCKKGCESMNETVKSSITN